jgi:tetratricopeptide (TPR) repeat protein
MKSFLAFPFFLLMLSPGLPGCLRTGRAVTPEAASGTRGAPEVAEARVDPCALVLAPLGGEGKLDREIARLQGEAARRPDPCPSLERLGYSFVAKARKTSDPGWYRLAEECALCLESKSPGSAAALLLRGHALQSLHRFRDAEDLARQLVASRGSPFDHALLGDAVLEQGRLEEALGAYQKMVDLKPCLQSYSRAAHLRWLRGDLPGAIEAMGLAAEAGSPADPDSLAWVLSRLALYRLQSGDWREALRDCEAALRLEPDHPAALLTRGRTLLAAGRNLEALDPLERSAALCALPENQWVLADALRAGGRAEEAARVEEAIGAKGARSDPRTFALFLATRGREAAQAQRLAEEELKVRADVFTHDCLAWALLAAGRAEEAGRAMEKALAEGTQDARLFLHAGAVALALGRGEEARARLQAASAAQGTLIPSERERLSKYLEDLSRLPSQPRPEGAANTLKGERT